MLSLLLLAHLKRGKGALSWVAVKLISDRMAQIGGLFTQINITVTIRGLYILHIQIHRRRTIKNNIKKYKIGY